MPGRPIIGNELPTIPPDVSLDEARRRAATILEPVSLGEAHLDARIFVEEAAGLDRAGLLREGDRRIGIVAAACLTGFIHRRLAGEPVWRVLGHREFWGLRFSVTPAVLDPRPDTETLVAAALDALSDRRHQPLTVLDLGVGSGAILCAVLSELPQAYGWGLDRSAEACGVARRNIAVLGLADRAAVIVGNWAAALRGGRCDLVVSNPPYIESEVIPTLAREVREFDPRGALDGGPDGLACYRTIVADLPRLLTPGGVAVLEVGAGQAEAVGALLAKAGLPVTAVRSDLGGLARAVVAVRPGSRDGAENRS